MLEQLVAHKSLGSVLLLESSETLCRVVSAAVPEDEREVRAFWTRRETLYMPPVYVPPAPDVIPQTDCTASWADLAGIIADGPYRLDVHAKHDFIEQAEYEYLAWSDDLLPEGAIRIYENRPTGREWRLSFPLPECARIPFPIDIMGITGQQPTRQPRGLLKSGRVYVYFTELVEQFVRAGLRATI